MAEDQRHIIGRQTIALKIADQDAAKNWQRLISGAMEKEFSQQLSHRLDEICPPGELIRIDRLEVDIAEINEENFLDKLLEGVYAAVNKAVTKSSSASGDVSSKPVREGGFQALVYFLINGHLPWWYKPSVASQNLQALLPKLEKHELSKLRLQLQQDIHARFRLSYLIPEATIWEWLRKTSIPVRNLEAGAQFFEKVQKQKFSKSPAQTSQYVKYALLGVWVDEQNQTDRTPDAFLKDCIDAFSSSERQQFSVFIQKNLLTVSRGLDSKTLMGEDADIAKIVQDSPALKGALEKFVKGEQGQIQTLAKKQGQTQKQDQDQIHDHTQSHVQDQSHDEGPVDNNADTKASAESKKNTAPLIKNKSNQEEELSKKDAARLLSHAGLILLHPFLTQLFSNLALLTDKKTFVDQDARRKALHVLAWLATGNEEVPEYDLQMPKLLTGWPLHEPISPFIDIDENAQKMSKELLQAVITHWNALGKTTPAGLREGFIQREGRLCLEDRGWRLQVEQRTLDILLGKLPWGLGVVRLPWMDKLLFVDWA